MLQVNFINFTVHAVQVILCKEWYDIGEASEFIAEVFNIGGFHSVLNLTF